MAETDPIHVFSEDGKWVIDYGSYANGYHPTRGEAIQVATRAGQDEHRKIVVDDE